MTILGLAESFKRMYRSDEARPNPTGFSLTQMKVVSKFNASISYTLQEISRQRAL